MMEQLLLNFMKEAEGDGRIGPSHISLYMALIVCAGENLPGPFTIHRLRLMQLAKMSARQTYTKRMQELHSFGYIQYEPSHDRNVGSRAKFI